MDRAVAMAERCGIAKAYGSYDALLADSEIEVVYVALPNHLHVEWARKAADAGKHVLIEKPAALTRADLAALDGVDPGLRIAEAFMVRHQPRWQALRLRLTSGAHGEVRTVSSLLSFMMTKTDDFRTRPEWGGGAVGRSTISAATRRWLRASSSAASPCAHSPSATATTGGSTCSRA
jgi:predicted dehydrogenase